METTSTGLTAEQIKGTMSAPPPEPAAPPPAPVAAAPAAEPAPQPDPPSPPPAVPPAPPAPSKDAEIAELRAKLAEANGKPDEAAALRAEFDAFRSSVHTTDSEQRAAARSAAFDRLRIDPDYRDVVPAEFDPRTAAGRKSMEEWIAKRPAIQRSGAPRPPEQVRNEIYSEPVRSILEGKRSSTLLSPASIAKMVAGRGAGR